jgi:hypothetical protein
MLLKIAHIKTSGLQVPIPEVPPMNISETQQLLSDEHWYYNILHSGQKKFTSLSSNGSQQLT